MPVPSLLSTVATVASPARPRIPLKRLRVGMKLQGTVRTDRGGVGAEGEGVRERERERERGIR